MLFNGFLLDDFSQSHFDSGLLRRRQYQEPVLSDIARDGRVARRAAPMLPGRREDLVG